MARSLQLEATEGHCKTAEHGLVRADDLRVAHTAWIAMPRPATRNNLQVTASRHETRRPWPHAQGEAMALYDRMTSGRGEHMHATM